MIKFLKTLGVTIAVLSIFLLWIFLIKIWAPVVITLTIVLCVFVVVWESIN